MSVHKRLSPEVACGAKDTASKVWTEEEIVKFWPSARHELLGFAIALDKDHAHITAAQIRLAVQLAQDSFDLRRDSSLNPEVKE